MKPSFAFNQSASHPNTNCSVVRTHYAHLATRTRCYGQAHTSTVDHLQVSYDLISVNIYQNNLSELAYLLRLLKRLSESHKWITLIAPPANFSLSLFTQAGIDQSQIRIARPTASHNAAALMAKALKSDTSAAVIGFGHFNQFANIIANQPEPHTPSFVISGIPEQLH